VKRAKLLFPSMHSARESAAMDLLRCKPRARKPRCRETAWQTQILKRIWRAHHDTNSTGETLGFRVFTCCQQKARPIAHKTGDLSTSTGDLEPGQPRRISGQDTTCYSITQTWTCPTPRAENLERIQPLSLKDYQQMQAGLSFHHYVSTRNWTKVTKHCTFTAVWLMVCGHFQ